MVNYNEKMDALLIEIGVDKADKDELPEALDITSKEYHEYYHTNYPKLIEKLRTAKERIVSDEEIPEGRKLDFFCEIIYETSLEFMAYTFPGGGYQFEYDIVYKLKDILKSAINIDISKKLEYVLFIFSCCAKEMNTHTCDENKTAEFLCVFNGAYKTFKRNGYVEAAISSVEYVVNNLILNDRSIEKDEKGNAVYQFVREVAAIYLPNELDPFSDSESNETETLDRLLLKKGIDINAYTEYLAYGSDYVVNLEKSDKYEDSYTLEDFITLAMNHELQGDYSSALEVIMDGISHFTTEADLYPLAIIYALEAGERDAAAVYFRLLTSFVPLQKWKTSLFYQAIVKFLKADVPDNKDAIRAVIELWKVMKPDEKVYLAEYEFEMNLNHPMAAVNALKEGIEVIKNSVLIAERLAKLQLDSGDYTGLLRTCNYGLSAFDEGTSKAMEPKFLFMRVLAKDHLIWKKIHVGQTVSAKEIEIIDNEYDALQEVFPDFMRPHLDMVETRKKALKFIKF